LSDGLETTVYLVCHPLAHTSARVYSSYDQPAPESRPVVTALLFEPA
jgi:hypothetical protein